MAYSKKTHTLLKRGKKAAKEFREFVRFIGGFDPVKHQEEQVEACQDIGDNPQGGQKYLVIAPPGSGKTTLIAVLFLAWMIGKYPEDHFGLLSFANDQAWKRSSSIRKIIDESKPYHFTFPDIKKDPQSWGSKAFRVKRKNIISPHATLRAGGTKSAVLGDRMTGLVLDDAVDKKIADSTDQLDKAFDNYEGTILTRLKDNAWQMNIGTRWCGPDFIGRLLKRKHEGWIPIHVPALNRHGKTYWPPDGEGNGYSDKFMEVKKLESPAMFAMQYMGDTTGGEAQIIKKLTKYKEVPSKALIEEKDLLVAVGIDSAYKEKERNDFSVCYVGGLDAYGRIWILDRRKGRFSTPKLMDEIYDIQEEWEPFTQWIEDSAAGTPAVQTIQAESPDVPLEAVVPSQGGKRSRVHALAPYIHRGQIVFPEMAPWLEDAEYHLTHFPYTGYDDDPDALWTLVAQLLDVPHPSAYDRRRDARGVKMR